MECIGKGIVRKALCRQGIYLAKAFRGSFRRRNPYSDRNKGQHEEQADTTLGQDYVAQAICHRMH